MALNRTDVAELYVATFGRAADAAGLAYWTNDSGLDTLNEVAASFWVQPETQTHYAGMSNRQTVDALYQQLFGRAADEAGLDYWVEALIKGDVQKEDVVLALIKGAQDTTLGNDKTTMDNKTTVAVDFADAGLDDVNQAAAVMVNVTDDAATVAAAEAQIQLWEDEGTNFSLSVNEDDIVGTTQDDIVEGSTNAAVATSTYQSFDNVDGSVGNDTFNLRMTNGSITATAIVKDVETFNITNQDVADTFDGVQVTGMETLNVVGTGSATATKSTMNLINMQNIVELGANMVTNGQTDIINVSYVPSAISGTADHQVVNLGSNDAVTVTEVTGGIEVLDLHTGTGAQNFTDAVTGGTTNVDGAANLTLASGALNIDASTATGNLTINAANTGNATINGGTGNDTINGPITAAGKLATINGNAGDDTINLNGVTGAFSHVTGGTGVDLIRLSTTTTTIDTVNFAKSGDTGIAQNAADHVVNFETTIDKIDFAGLRAGTATTAFVVPATKVAGFSAGETAANAAFKGSATAIYAFETDGVDGYLFVDSNNDHRADEVVILDGLSTVKAFASGDIA